MNESHPFQNTQTRWSNYYRAVEGRPPRQTLLRALEHVESSSAAHTSKLAVDLGCGDGRDTVELLRRGWQVLGIDGEMEAIARLRTRKDVDLTHLDTRIEAFEQLSLCKSSADLINASFCLPFCTPTAFPKMWETIVDALRPYGIFCGQLFGDRDSWVDHTVTFTRSQVEALLVQFEVVWLDEEDHPGKTALGEDKHWHIFNIVAQKG